MFRRWLLRLITDYSFHRWYWRIRSVYQYGLFRFGELAFRFKTTVSDIGISVSIFWRLLKSIIGSIAVAIVALLVILVHDQETFSGLGNARCGSCLQSKTAHTRSANS